MSSSTTFAEKHLYAFNKFYYELISQLKSVSPECKDIIRKNYKIKDYKTSDNYSLVKTALAGVQLGAENDAATSPSQCVINQLAGIEHPLLIELPLKQAVEYVPSESHGILASYIVLLNLMIVVSHVGDEELLEKALSVIGNLQHGSSDGIDDVLDDDVVSHLSLLRTLLEEQHGTTAYPDAVKDQLPAFIANTKIGEITREIVDDLDLSKIQIEKPEDLLDFKKNNVLGDIVSKVGTTFQKKLEKGELKHEELLSEAMGMLGSLAGSKDGKAIFDSPLFKEILKSTSKGASGTKAVFNKGKLDALSTRERLKKKLESRALPK